MPDSEPKFELKAKHHFAAQAEALHVNTDEVIAVIPHDGVFTVLYTDEIDGASTQVYGADLALDADNILVVKGQPRLIPGGIEQLQTALDDMEDVE